MRVAWIAALSLLVAPMAAEAACSTPYTTDGLLADLGAIDGFLAKGDDAAAGSGARQMASGLACLDSVLPLPIIGRVYRSLGGGLLVSGDTENGMRWLVTSAELEGTFEYGMEIPETSPIRSAWAEAQGLAGGDLVGVDGRILKGGADYFLDGRKLALPKARQDRPHLLQARNPETQAVDSWIIQGNEFPEEALGVPEVAAVGPKPKPGKVDPANPPKPRTRVDSSGAVVIERQRPIEKTPLMIGGAVIAVGSGAVYFVSSLTRKKFDEAETLEDSEKFRRTTNQLVVVSGIVLGVGIGTFTWGAVVDADTVIPTFGSKF